MTDLNKFTLQVPQETYRKLDRDSRLLGMSIEEYAALLLTRGALALPQAPGAPQTKQAKRKR